MVVGAMFTLSERAYTSFHPDANQKVRAVTRNGWRVARCRAPCGPIIAGDLPGRGGPPAKPSGNRKTSKKAHVFHSPPPCTTALRELPGDKVARKRDPPGALSAGRDALPRVRHACGGGVQDPLLPPPGCSAAMPMAAVPPIGAPNTHASASFPVPLRAWRQGPRRRVASGMWLVKPPVADAQKRVPPGGEQRDRGLCASLCWKINTLK